MKLLYGVGLLLIVYIVGWHQLHGQFIHPWFKKYEPYLLLLSIPTTYLSIKSVKFINDYFNGQMWPNRILTFSLGIILFTVLTSIYFDEKPSLKTGILIGLSTLTLILQIFWK